MSQIIFNARIDAALCAFFIAVSLAILAFSLRAVVIAYRNKDWTAREFAVPAE